MSYTTTGDSSLYFVSCTKDVDHSRYDERPHIGRLLTAPNGDPEAKQIGIVGLVQPGPGRLLAADLLRSQQGVEMVYLRTKGQFMDGVRLELVPRDPRLEQLVGTVWVQLYADSANMTLVPSSQSAESGRFAQLRPYGQTA
jgi:hypothetical protein